MESSMAEIEDSTAEEIVEFIKVRLNESKESQSVWMNYERQVVFKYDNETRNNLYSSAE